MKFYIIILFFFSSVISGNAQEFFPNNESASNIPKGVFSVHNMNETYRDLVNRPKVYNSLRVMYGLGKRLTLIGSVSASNHHFSQLPPNFSYYFINHHRKNFPLYPYLFEGLNLYAKWRIVSIDEEGKHFRVAVYGEIAKSFAAHDEAEPRLMTDNSGYGGGIIVTYLINRFAVSSTLGIIRPAIYKSNDYERRLTFKSGDAYVCNISFGYRLYPKEYKNYKDLNINIYMEFMNKSYDAAQITLNGKPYDFDSYKSFDPYTYQSLQGNTYSELRTSLQFILNSKSKLDLCVATPVYSRSYMHNYPLIMIGIQRYFY